MRTTVAIDDELLSRARREAEARGISLGHILEEGLQEYFAARHGAPGIPPLTYPTFAGRWLAPVDPASNRELFDFLDRLDSAATCSCPIGEAPPAGPHERPREGCSHTRRL